MGRDANCYGVHSQFSCWAQAGTIPEAVGKIGPAPDTISVPLVIEAQNSSCSQGVVKETGEKITLIVQTFYRFRVLIVHDWKKRYVSTGKGNNG